MAATFTETADTVFQYASPTGKKITVRKGSLVISGGATTPTAATFGFSALYDCQSAIHDGTNWMLVAVRSNSLYKLDMTTGTAIVDAMLPNGTYVIDRIEGSPL